MKRHWAIKQATSEVISQWKNWKENCAAAGLRKKTCARDFVREILTVFLYNTRKLWLKKVKEFHSYTFRLQLVKSGAQGSKLPKFGGWTSGTRGETEKFNHVLEKTNRLSFTKFYSSRYCDQLEFFSRKINVGRFLKYTGRSFEPWKGILSFWNGLRDKVRKTWTDCIPNRCRSDSFLRLFSCIDNKNVLCKKKEMQVERW